MLGCDRQVITHNIQHSSKLQLIGFKSNLVLQMTGSAALQKAAESLLSPDYFKDRGLEEALNCLPPLENHFCFSLPVQWPSVQQETLSLAAARSPEGRTGTQTSLAAAGSSSPSPCFYCQGVSQEHQAPESGSSLTGEGHNCQLWPLPASASSSSRLAGTSLLSTAVTHIQLQLVTLLWKSFCVRN